MMSAPCSRGPIGVMARGREHPLPAPLLTRVGILAVKRVRALMSHLKKLLAPIPVRTFEAGGWPSKAFEAAAFAVLAYLTMSGECGNVPSVTGARKAVVLGTIVPGRRGGRKALP